MTTTYLVLNLAVTTQIHLPLVGEGFQEFRMTIPHVTATPEPFLQAGAEVLHNNNGMGYETPADAWQAFLDYQRHLESEFGRIL